MSTQQITPDQEDAAAWAMADTPAILQMSYNSLSVTVRCPTAFWNALPYKNDSGHPQIIVDHDATDTMTYYFVHCPDLDMDIKVPA